MDSAVTAAVPDRIAALEKLAGAELPERFRGLLIAAFLADDIAARALCAELMLLEATVETVAASYDWEPYDALELVRAGVRTNRRIAREALEMLTAVRGDR
jgi:hypothetical protein